MQLTFVSDFSRSAHEQEFYNQKLTDSKGWGFRRDCSGCGSEAPLEAAWGGRRRGDLGKGERAKGVGRVANREFFYTGACKTFIYILHRGYMSLRCSILQMERQIRVCFFEISTDQKY